MSRQSAPAFFWFLVVSSVLFAALPAALFAGIGISVLVTLRARGLLPPALLPLGAGSRDWLRRACRRRFRRRAVAGALNGAMPKVSRVGVLWDPGTPFHTAMLKEIAAAAPSLRLQPLAIAVKNRADLGDALSEITKQRADALFVSQGMSPAARRQLLEFAAKNRLPTMFMIKDYVPAGGLMSYAPNYLEMYLHAAPARFLQPASPCFTWQHS